MYRVKEVSEEKRWPDEGLYSGKKKETQNKRVRQRRQSETWGVHLFQQCILCLRKLSSAAWDDIPATYDFVIPW